VVELPPLVVVVVAVVVVAVVVVVLPPPVVEPLVGDEPLFDEPLLTPAPALGTSPPP
jgi:hypothetical protein